MLPTSIALFENARLRFAVRGARMIPGKLCNASRVTSTMEFLTRLASAGPATPLKDRNVYAMFLAH